MFLPCKTQFTVNAKLRLAVKHSVRSLMRDIFLFKQVNSKTDVFLLFLCMSVVIEAFVCLIIHMVCSFLYAMLLFYIPFCTQIGLLTLTTGQEKRYILSRGLGVLACSLLPTTQVLAAFTQGSRIQLCTTGHSATVKLAINEKCKKDIIEINFYFIINTKTHMSLFSVA